MAALTAIDIKHPFNRDAVELLEEWLELAKRGEIISVGLVGLGPGSQFRTAHSRSDNTMMDGAMLIMLALRRMGFEHAG